MSWYEWRGDETTEAGHPGGNGVDWLRKQTCWIQSSLPFCQVHTIFGVAPQHGLNVLSLLTDGATSLFRTHLSNQTFQPSKGLCFNLLSSASHLATRHQPGRPVSG